jgi:hypothetical protein
MEVTVIESCGKRLGSGERSANVSLLGVLGYVAARASEYTHFMSECKMERRQRPSLNCTFALPLVRPTRRRATEAFSTLNVSETMLAVESREAVLSESMSNVWRGT